MSKQTKPEVKPVDAAASSAALGRKRRRKIGVLSAISVIFVIAAVIAANYFIDYIADRYVLEIDMTSESEYEISDETAQLLGTLTEPITITVLCDETDYADDDDLRRLPKILQRYEQLSDGMVTVKYINAVTNPSIFNKYNDLGDLSTADIIVESEKRYKSMDPYDLLEYTTSSTDSTTSYVTGLRAEQRLTSAILYVTANKVPKAAYITGHQETTDLEEMDSLLTSGNYEVTSLSLMQENEIPSDVDMVIISQPMGDYTDEEIEILDQFLNNGGHMIVTYASNTPSLPNLEAYFEEWGVQYESQMVYDTERCYAGWNAYILPNITTVENLTDNLDSKSYAIIPGARPISVLWDQDNWRGTQVLMTTSNNSYAKDLSTESTAYEKTDDDETGPFNVGVLAYQTEMHNLNSTYSYILFLNAGFVSDSALSSQSFLNKDYFLAALNFMSDDSESVVIASKDLTTDNLVVPGSAKTVLYYLLIFIIPGVCLLGGVLVWARRRHK
jgi:ABC-2 type transport system permease protein